jgi:hypothetical protein
VPVGDGVGVPVGDGEGGSVGEGESVGDGEPVADGVGLPLGSAVGVGDSWAKADDAVHTDRAITASASVARAPPPRNRDICR